MYKKILALLLCAALLLFSGCSGETSSGDASPSSEASTTVTPETTPMRIPQNHANRSGTHFIGPIRVTSRQYKNITRFVCR